LNHTHSRCSRGDIAALREAVLAFYEDSVTPPVEAAKWADVAEAAAAAWPLPRLQWLKLLRLLQPVLLIGLVRMVVTGRARKAADLGSWRPRPDCHCLAL
jgi:hypothetical protein